MEKILDVYNTGAMCYTVSGRCFIVKRRYIPLEKRSKREQKAYHASRRGSWGGVNPVTKMSPNPKAYNRRKSGRPESLPGFFVINSDIQALFNFRLCQYRRSGVFQQ